MCRAKYFCVCACVSSIGMADWYGGSIKDRVKIIATFCQKAPYTQNESKKRNVYSLRYPYILMGSYVFDPLTHFMFFLFTLNRKIDRMQSLKTKNGPLLLKMYVMHLFI